LFVVEEFGGEVDEAGVLGVEVPGDFVEGGVEIGGVTCFGGLVVDGGRHELRIVHMSEKVDETVQVFDRTCDAAAGWWCRCAA
jgi:hypothetical protein